VATPTITTDINNVYGFLCKPEELDPKPAKEYPCTKP